MAHHKHQEIRNTTSDRPDPAASPALREAKALQREHKQTPSKGPDKHSPTSVSPDSIEFGSHDSLYGQDDQNYSKLFLGVHELQDETPGKEKQFDNDLAGLNKSLHRAGLRVSSDSSYSNQIHLYKNGQLDLTATYLEGGDGRDAQVIENSNHDVVFGGITYYEKGKNGQERFYSHGSTRGIPPEAMFEETDLTSQQGCNQAIQRLRVMHSIGIKTVVLAADEVSPLMPNADGSGSTDFLNDYAQEASKLHMSIIWNLSADKNGDSGPLVWLNMKSTDGSGQFEKFRDAYEAQYDTDTPPNNEQLLAYMIKQLSSTPATIGYYAADDSNIPSRNSPQVAALNSYLSQLRNLDPDPNHQIFVGAYGQDQRELYQKDLGSRGSVIDEEYPIYWNAKMDTAFNTLNADGEPYLVPPKSDLEYQTDSPEGLKTEITDTERGASKNHERSAFALQAFDWESGCVYPSYADQVGMRNITLTRSHAQNIFWYWLPGTLGGASAGPNSSSQSTEFVADLAAAINAPLPGTNYWQLR